MIALRAGMSWPEDLLARRSAQAPDLTRFDWVTIAHSAVAAPQEDPRRRRCPCQLLRQGAAALPGGLHYMANARDRNDQATVRRWKSLLLVSGLFLAGFGVWQMTLGHVGNGLGMIAVPAVVVSVLLLLINRRGDG